MRAGSLLILITMLAVSTLIAADNPTPENDPLSKQILEVKETEHVAFPPGGVLRLKNSLGDLNIEAWDEPSVEITIIKSSRDYLSPAAREQLKAEFGRVTVKAEREGNEVVIATNAPRHGFFSFGNGASFINGGLKFNFGYHISVPRNARLIIDNGGGAVNVDGVTGDIDAKLRRGEIMLHLPEDAKYNIDARTSYGNVNSDFPGLRHRGWLGQKALADEPSPAHKLKLRVRDGDIVLLRIRQPKYPDTAPAKPAGSGS